MARFSFAILAFLIVSAAFAADPRIENVVATAANGHVSVRFSLADGFRNGDVVQGLQSGLPTSFTYEIEIYRDRPNWFDEGIARSHVEVICTFNSVTREYLLNYRRDRKLVRSETYSDLASLESHMANIDERDLFDIGGRRAYKLRVRVRADLYRGWLLYVVPWEVTTRWRDVRVQTAESRP